MLNFFTTPIKNKLTFFWYPGHVQENFRAPYSSEKIGLAGETTWQYGTGWNHHEHKEPTAKVWHCVVNETTWLRSDTEPSTDVLLVRNCLCILTLVDRKVSLHPYYREEKCPWEVWGFDLKSDIPESSSGAGTLWGPSCLSPHCKIWVVELRAKRRKWEKCRHENKIQILNCKTEEPSALHTNR